MTKLRQCFDVVLFGISVTWAYSWSKISSIFKYKPNKVWKFQAQGGKWGAFNRPTAGPTFDRDLPRGNHDLQLYSLGTPNGMKVTALLEEINLRYGVEYDAWMVDIGSGEQFGSGFVRANPNSKIPALLHYNYPSLPDRGEEEPNGRRDARIPARVFESAAIMIHVCEVYDSDGAFLPPVGDPARTECLSWLLWTQGSAPYLGGGFGHFFKYAPVKIRYAIDRYTMETKRQLDVLERHLSGSDADGGNAQFSGGPFLCGDRLTIADICCYPWYGRLVAGKLYSGSDEFLQVKEYPHVIEWATRVGAREGVRRGCMVNRVKGDGGGVLRERHSSNDFHDLDHQHARINSDLV